MKKWKIVFGLFLVLFILDIIGLPFKEKHEASDFVRLILAGFSLYPLYGYAYQTSIGNKIFAITIFSISCIGVVAFIVLGAFLLIETPNLSTLFGAVFASFFMFIFIYPQFMYAFKSNHLWQNLTNSSSGSDNP